jgi:hypothetical protein
VIKALQLKRDEQSSEINVLKSQIEKFNEIVTEGIYICMCTYLYIYDIHDSTSIDTNVYIYVYANRYPYVCIY